MPLQLSPLGRGIHYLTRPVSSLEDRTGSEGEAVRNVEVLWLRPVSLLSPLGDVPSSFPESSYK